MSKLHAYTVRRAFLFAPLVFCFSVSVSFSSGWSGTGFLVGKLPVVVTNYHVAAGAKQIKMTFRDGRTAKGKVLRLDMHNDLALIGFDKLAEKPPATHARFRVAPSDAVRPGQEAYVMGYPVPGDLGNRLSITKGIIASTVGADEDNRHFRITAQVNPGNSGGPLLDAKGRVIGVIFAGMDLVRFFNMHGNVPEGTNFAIKSSLLSSMLADFEEDAPQDADLPDLTGDKIFASYRDAVVLIEASDKPEKPEKSESGEDLSSEMGFGAQQKGAVVIADTREAAGWARKAHDNVAKGNWAEAIRAASAAIALHPGLSGPYADRCFAYYKRTLYDDAASDCDKAVELDPHNDLAYSYRALAYCEKGFVDQALIDANRAIELSPKNMSYYNNRGVVLERRGATDKAKADYEDACRTGVEIACKNFTRLAGFSPTEIPRMVKDLLEESIVCFNNGQMDRVIDITSKVIKLDPKNDIAYANRGGAYANKGSLLQAIDDCNTAIRINPDCGLAFNNKGFAHEQLGQTAEALLSYEISCNLGVELGCKNKSRITGTHTTNKE
jgi:S1-C subfamily serine protease/Tfp pilus assembly protein PilF